MRQTKAADLLADASPSTIDRALADMRSGRRVLVVALTAPGLRALFDSAKALLVDGERARVGNGLLITGADRAMILFETVNSARAGCRGVDLDSVYVDHDELRMALMPALSAAADPVFVCS